MNNTLREGKPFLVFICKMFVHPTLIPIFLKKNDEVIILFFNITYKFSFYNLSLDCIYGFMIHILRCSLCFKLRYY